MTGVEGDTRFRGNVRNIQCGLYVGGEVFLYQEVLTDKNKISDGNSKC